MNRGGRLLAAGLACLAFAACDKTATSPTSTELRDQRAAWQANQLTRYAYTYRFTGYFIQGVGMTWRVVVLNDSVVSTTDSATGLAPAWGASGFPTISALFDHADAAAAAGSLTHVDFDPALHYPTRIDVAGPPDASGSLYASSLTPLP